MIQTKPVILCGGSGTRLWPLSRAGFPKQFLCLTGDNSLFQQAANRLMALASPEIAVAAPYIVTNEEHRFLALEQLREIGIELGGGSAGTGGAQYCARTHAGRPRGGRRWSRPGPGRYPG